MRILAFVTDAFGGHGGIALYNRDVLTALCHYTKVQEVRAIIRLLPHPPGNLPAKLVYDTSGTKGLIFYLCAVLKHILNDKDYDLILCAHINLIPLAYLVGKLTKAPVVLQIYGIDAWEEHSSLLVNKLLPKITTITSISRYTTDRFLSWSKVSSECCYLLPNAIHLEQYGMGPKSSNLCSRYQVEGKTVLLTLGRLVSKQRAKGFDEILEILGSFAKTVPDLVYIIAGDGPDSERLHAKVVELGLEDKVIFAGMVNEAEKADLYRLADVYVMPSRGEGFGFVFLEAMACGVPVIASKADGGRDAVCNGELGLLVDPDNPEEIKAATLKALKMPKEIPTGLTQFSFDNFCKRLYDIIETTLTSHNQTT